MALAGPWPVCRPLARRAALTLFLCCVPSAYTEPYKVCPISAVAPKEDLTSEEERGSSEEEEDRAVRDPGLPHKVGGRPVRWGVRDVKVEGRPNPFRLQVEGAAFRQLSPGWTQRPSLIRRCCLKTRSRRGPRDAAGMTAHVRLGPWSRGLYF